MKKGYSKAALFLASQAVTLLGSSIVQFAIIWYVTLYDRRSQQCNRLTGPRHLGFVHISHWRGARRGKMWYNLCIFIN